MKKNMQKDVDKFVSRYSEKEGDPNDFNNSRNILLTNLFSAFSSVLFLSLGLSAFLRDEYIISAVFFSITFLSLINMVLLKIYKNHGFSSGFLIVLLNLSAIYAIMFGGIDNTGILMAFMLPPVLIFLRGSKTGGIVVLIMTALAIGILFFIDPKLVLPDYSVPMKVVFIVCFVAVAVFSFLHEFTREMTFKKLEDVASHDPLTGLLNRRELERFLNSEMLRSKRYGNPFSIIICDIDDFKKLNDVYGHQFGDTVLKMISNIFRSGTRVQEYICRWGGEEFLIVLPETKVDGAMVVAERLRERIAEEKIVFGNEELVITASFGVGEFDTNKSIEENIEVVDKAMYNAKKAGKNCVRKV
jgi:diguanylate cyclase (GGDEF)-like protein